MKEDWEIHWEDYYRILGVNPDASQEEIKKAYRDKVFIFHSDRFVGAPESARRQAEEELKKINQAYSVLKDPEKRQWYHSEWINKKGKDFERATANEIYCPGCGRPIKREAVICPHCGVQVRELKVYAETEYAETYPLSPEEELEEGRRQLGGVKVFLWCEIVSSAMGIFFISTKGDPEETLSAMVVFGFFMAIFIIALRGIINRRPYSVPFIRFLLIPMFVAFPIGTIIGAVLWKRINHPLAKRYLNYGTWYERNEEEKIEKEKTYKTTAEGKIAFVSDRDGYGEIYIMDPDGKNQIRLTNDDSEDVAPSWSPDGSKIAFVSDRDSYRDGNDEIYIRNVYIMSVDGSGQKNLTNNPAEDGMPSFSPDGSKIAFESNRDGNYEIYIINVDGSEQTRLTKNPAWDLRPSFSPDGSKIAFTSNRDGNYEIYIMDPDGKNQIRLTNNDSKDVSPSWSPDGSKIAFESNRDGNCEIYIMNVDGSEQTRLTNNPAEDRQPCFSPDGAKIAFGSWRDGNWEIYIMNVDGSGQTRLTNNPTYDGEPSFSL